MEQKSPAWHNERTTGIGGSEIAIILGLSPYKTPYQLWQEKTGQVIPEDISNRPHVVRGILGEKVARLILERDTLHSYTPKTWKIEGTPFRCSDDGYSADLETILEIKCMARAYHEKVKLEGVIPEFYVSQCQYNLAVSKAKKCLFVSFVPETEELVKVEVYPDLEMQKMLLKAAKDFWDKHVVPRIPPEFTDKDFVVLQDDEFETLSLNWKQLKAQMKILDENLTETESKLKEFAAKHPAIMGEILKITRFTRRGNIDYAAIKELGSVDLEQYRKPETTSYRITALK